MRPLSPHELLFAWEQGRDRHPVDRAALLRTLSAPGADPAALADEPLGARNAALLRVRAATFGRRLRALVDCPQCSAPLEIELDTVELLATCPVPLTSVEVAGVRFRPPTNRDLARIAVEDDADTATRRLLMLCAIDQLEDIDVDAVLTEVETALEGADPWSDLALVVHCDACEQQWSEPLDVPELLWDDVQHRARVLLDQVHVLAHAYGWTEDIVLGLSDQRRAAYLERVTA